MTIYDVKFYGVYFYYKAEFSSVTMYQTKEQVHTIPGFENLFFDVIVLKEFEGKNNVLKLEFEDGTYKHETLEYPFEYLEDGKWKKSHNTVVSDAFMKLYFSILLN